MGIKAVLFDLDGTFVGDHLENDIRASRKVGLKAIWKRNDSFSSEAEAYAIIDDLMEIVAIVVK